MGRLLSLCVALLLSVSACAGTFKEVRKGVYEFTGGIVASDVDNYRKILSENAKISLTIDSPGGERAASVALGYLTRDNSSKVRITVGECFSGAAYWSIADDDYRFRNERSFLAFHLPTWYGGGTQAQYMISGYSVGTYLNFVLGPVEGKKLFYRMADVRDDPSVNWVVWMRDSRDAGNYDWLKKKWSFEKESDARTSPDPPSKHIQDGFERDRPASAGS